MKTQIILLALTLIVLSSGCLLTQQVSTNGIVIEEFSSSLSEISPGEQVQFRLKIRNSGSVQAENIKFELFGVSYGDWMCTTDCAKMDYLRAPDPESNTEGETRECIWDCIAPELKTTYSPGARVWYDYKTNIIRSITVVSHDELQRLADKGETLASESISSTTSPVSVDVQIKTPLKYWPEKNEITFPIAFKIDNTGNGVACIENCEERDWNYIILYITSELELSDCELKANSENKIQLWEGNTRTITCNAKINERATIQTKKTIDAMAEYTYFTDKITSVKVA